MRNTGMHAQHYHACATLSCMRNTGMHAITELGTVEWGAWRRCSTRATPRPTRPRCRHRLPATLWCGRPGLPPHLPPDMCPTTDCRWNDSGDACRTLLLVRMSDWGLVLLLQAMFTLPSSRVRAPRSAEYVLWSLTHMKPRCHEPKASAWPGAGSGQLHAARDACHAGHRAGHARHAEAGRHAPRALHHAARAARPRRRPRAGGVILSCRLECKPLPPPLRGPWCKRWSRSCFAVLISMWTSAQKQESNAVLQT